MLNYLRTGKLGEELTRRELLELQQEAGYFQLTSLEEMIQNKLESEPIKFVVIEADQKGGQISHYISARRSWFGKIPIPVVASILDIKDPEDDIMSIPKLVQHVKSINNELCTVDADGNNCVYNEFPNRVLDAIFEMKNRKYKSNRAKALVFLRDYYYADQTEFEFKVGSSTFKCKKSIFDYADVKLISFKGDLVAPNHNKEDLMRRINHPTLEDFVRRLLRRLEDNRVGDVQPPERTELWDDSRSAHFMGLLPDYPNYKWFY